MRDGWRAFSSPLNLSIPWISFHEDNEICQISTNHSRREEGAKRRDKRARLTNVGDVTDELEAIYDFTAESRIALDPKRQHTSKESLAQEF